MIMENQDDVSKNESQKPRYGLLDLRREQIAKLAYERYLSGVCDDADANWFWAESTINKNSC